MEKSIDNFEKAEILVKNLRSEFKKTSSLTADAWGEKTIKGFEDAYVIGAMKAKYVMLLDKLGKTKG